MKSEAKHLAKKAYWEQFTAEQRSFEMSRRAKKKWAKHTPAYKKAFSDKLHLAKRNKKLSTT